jgi:DNA invertase Pin-like site-specific DNA recombinase
MTTFLYSRVSTGTQVKHGESLEVQRNLLEDYAKNKKLKNLVFVEEAGVSAAKTATKNRKQWQGMFARLQPGDVVVATRLDRIFRSVADAATTISALKSKKVHLHLVEKNGLVAGGINEELQFHIVAAVAQFDSQLKSERIREVKASMRSRFIYSGGRKMKGFSKAKVEGNVMLTVDESEKRALEKCVEWMKKRDEEGATRSRKFSAAVLRNHLISTNKIQDNWKKKNQKKVAAGAVDDSMKKWGLATLYRLLDGKNPNNAVQRLSRLKQLERLQVRRNGKVAVLKKQKGRGGQMALKV